MTNNNINNNFIYQAAALAAATLVANTTWPRKAVIRRACDLAEELAEELNSRYGTIEESILFEPQSQ